MRKVYSAIFYLLLPLIFLRLLIKSRRLPGYRQRWRERLGFVAPVTAPCIWIHAVSMGETLACVPLIKALKQADPQTAIILTNMTPTGSEQANKSLADQVLHAFMPYDYPTAIKRFLKRVQPKLLIIMETELWPNVVHYAAAQAIPILLANARLSVQSFTGYRRIQFFLKSTLKKIDRIAAQTEADAQRFIALGAFPEKIIVTGSIKFDQPVPHEQVTAGRLLRSSWEERPVWIAASTHAGEEEKILQAHAEVKKQVTDALLILVPRHPERFQGVADLIRAQGFNVVQRSSGIPCRLNDDVLLGDSMGELFLYYAACDVAFVGGSLVAIGGHNVLEPAGLSLPIITGKHYFNFTEIVNKLLAAQAIEVISDENQLASTLIALFADATRRKMLGANAAQVVQANSGALACHLTLVKQLGREVNCNCSAPRHPAA